MTRTGTSVDSQSSEADATNREAPEFGTADASAVATLDRDRVFEVLQNQRRHMVVDHLLTHEGQVAIVTLARDLAARENDKDVRAVSSTERKRVEVGLYQSHQPKMGGWTSSLRYGARYCRAGTEL